MANISTWGTWFWFSVLVLTPATCQCKLWGTETMTQMIRFLTPHERNTVAFWLSSALALVLNQPWLSWAFGKRKNRISLSLSLSFFPSPSTFHVSCFSASLPASLSDTIANSSLVCFPSTSSWWLPGLLLLYVLGSFPLLLAFAALYLQLAGGPSLLFVPPFYTILLQSLSRQTSCWVSSLVLSTLTQSFVPMCWVTGTGCCWEGCLIHTTSPFFFSEKVSADQFCHR